MRDDDFPLSNRLLRELHRLLLQSGRGSEKQPGAFRRSQNWIGGRRPGVALYVPPPYDQVEPCMGELERFIHATDDGLPSLIRAGLAHAQFEAIHPFLDGNGRVGRMLIAFILVQSGALREPILYLSLYLKQFRSTYYDLLNQLRDDGDWEAWLQFFLEGVRLTAQHGVETAQRLTRLFEDDRQRIAVSGRRANSAIRAHHEFMQRPLLTISAVRDATSLSFSAADAAVQHLERPGHRGGDYGASARSALCLLGLSQHPERGTQSLRLSRTVRASLADRLDRTESGDKSWRPRWAIPSLMSAAVGLVTITYNRPEALNAINHELRADLNAAWEAFRHDDEAWGGIVTGAGRAFSAGADLRSPAPPEEHTFWEVPSLTSLESGMEVWKPTIAAVNGYALGFGLTMVAACDFVIASDRAQFGFPEVQIGVPTIQGAIRMPKRIGWHYAMELLLIGDRVDAWRAKEMGAGLGDRAA